MCRATCCDSGIDTPCLDPVALAFSLPVLCCVQRVSEDCIPLATGTYKNRVEAAIKAYYGGVPVPIAHSSVCECVQCRGSLRVIATIRLPTGVLINAKVPAGLDYGQQVQVPTANSALLGKIWPARAVPQQLEMVRHSKAVAEGIAVANPVPESQSAPPPELIVDAIAEGSSCGNSTATVL